MPVERGRITKHRKKSWQEIHKRKLQENRNQTPQETRKEIVIERQKEKENTKDFMKWHVTELDGSRKVNSAIADNNYVRPMTVPDMSAIKGTKQYRELHKEPLHVLLGEGGKTHYTYSLGVPTLCGRPTDERHTVIVDDLESDFCKNCVAKLGD